MVAKSALALLAAAAIVWAVAPTGAEAHRGEPAAARASVSTVAGPIAVPATAAQAPSVDPATLTVASCRKIMVRDPSGQFFRQRVCD